MPRAKRIIQALLLLVFCTTGCTVALSDQSDVHEPRNVNPVVERYKKAREQFLKFKADGYDVQEIEALANDFNRALKEQRPAEALLLLGQIEAKLDGIERRAAAGETGDTGQVPAEPTKPSRGLKDVGKGFGFGIEYAAHGLAKSYEDLGANWTKITNVAWDFIEPTPPVNGKHKYDWKRLDANITEYQAHNFNIMVELKSKSSWAMSTPDAQTGWKGAYLSALPRKEHMDDYADFIRSVVERYDADGKDDMPNLRMPVLHYEIESEAANYGFWSGTAQEYIKMTRTAHAAAKEANPDVIIVLSGINLGDWVYDMPTDAELERRIDARGPGTSRLLRKTLDFVRETLKAEDCFDVVEFHSNEDYRSMPGVVDWIRREMRKNGYEKPIWIGDALSVPPLIISTPGKIGFNPFPTPNGEEIYQAIKKKGRKTSEQRRLIDWYRAKQSDNLVKKFVLAMHLRLEGVMMGLTHDWPGYILHNFEYAGFIDALVVRTKPYPVLAVKEKRPVWYTYQLLIEKLNGATTVQKIDAGPDGYIYKFIVNKKPLFVCWAEDQHIKAKIDVGAHEVVKLEVVRESGQTSPRSEVVKAENGVIDLKLSSIPVFLEPRK